jgi:hypothetical protein
MLFFERHSGPPIFEFAIEADELLLRQKDTIFTYRKGAIETNPGRLFEQRREIWTVNSKERAGSTTNMSAQRRATIWPYSAGIVFPSFGSNHGGKLDRQPTEPFLIIFVGGRSQLGNGDLPVGPVSGGIT